MALSDLLSGRSVDDMLESLPRLWELCFRARDDIKVNVLTRFQPRSQGLSSYHPLDTRLPSFAPALCI